MNKELEYLRKNNPDLITNIEVINSLKQLREIAELNFDAPEPFKGILEAWHHFKMFAYSAMAMDDYPSLKKCWKDVLQIFKTFEDETFLEAYCFADFPLKEGKSFAEIFSADSEKHEGLDHIVDFASRLFNTRLGVYQVILANSKVIKLRESFTGKVYEVFNTIDVSNPGEIFLVRLFPVDGCYMLFGDPKVFPKERKKALEDMIIDKAWIYYSSFAGKNIDSDLELYELHLKLSGPYWMSLVTEDHSIDILDPDHWKNFLCK